METRPIVSNTDKKAAMGKRATIVIAVCAAIVFLGGAAYYIHNSSESKVSALTSGTVVITDKGVSPATIRIKKGQQITWQNKDTADHEVVSDGVPALSTANATDLSAGDTSTVTFEQSGTFQYHDSLTTPGFQGTVIVE